MPPPPEQHRHQLSLNRQQLDENSTQYTGHLQMNLAGALTEGEKKGVLTELKAAAAEPSNLREAIIKFVRAGKTDTWISKAEKKQFQI